MSPGCVFHAAGARGGPVLRPLRSLLPRSSLPSCPAHRPSPWREQHCCPRGPCGASPVSGRPVDPDGPARPGPGPGTHAGLSRILHARNSCCFVVAPGWPARCRAGCKVSGFCGGKRELIFHLRVQIAGPSVILSTWAVSASPRCQLLACG